MQSLSFIEKSIRFHNKLYLSFGIIFLLIIPLITLKNLTQSTEISFIIGMISLAFFLFYKSYQGRKFSNSNLYKFLNTDKENIVWIYRHQLLSMPFGVKTFERNTLYIFTRDKEKASLVIRNQDIDLLLSLLEKELPQATFGYSLQKEQLYRANPDLLKK